MNTQSIANLFLSDLATLPYVTRLAGIADTLLIKVTQSLTKRIPVALNYAKGSCNMGDYNSLVPDASEKAIMYFEDGGTRVLETNAMFMHMESRLQLVCWVNLKECGIATDVMAAMALKRLRATYPNTGILQQIQIKLEGIPPHRPSPFEKYTFDEDENQYITYPYDYFVFNIKAVYKIAPSCIVDVNSGSSSC